MSTKAFIPLKMLLKQFAGKVGATANMQGLSASRILEGRLIAATPAATWQRHYANEKQQQKQETAKTQQANEQNEEQQTAQAKELLLQIENLQKDLTAEKEKYNEVLDKYRRALADSENMRVRLNKQIQDAKIFGIQSFCKDMLEVADTLGHATQAVPKDKLNGNPDLKNLYEGLVMTRASLLQVFKRHGLEPVDPLNQKFDPNVHEALFQKEDKTVEPNTVVEVTKLGYKLHERCIRPALVGVSKC